jgi:hypothetical protein
MKLTGLLLLAILLFACGQKQGQTNIAESKKDTTVQSPKRVIVPEYEIRKRFHGFINNNGKLMDYKSLASWFSKFRTNYYPEETAQFNNYGEEAFLYYSINEELISPKEVSNRKWFRLLVSPTFERTFSFTLEKHSDCYRLTYNLYGHTYSQIPDHLMFSYCDQSFDTTKYNSFFTMLANKGFMQKKNFEKNTHILHPISFYFEAIDNNEYNRFERFGYDFGTKEDLKLMREAINLIRNSNIYPILKKLYPPDGTEGSDNPYEFIETLATE